MAAFPGTRVLVPTEERDPCVCEALHLEGADSLYLFLAEKTDGVYASINVGEHAAATSSQNYRVLYDYTAQVIKGLRTNAS